MTDFTQPRGRWLIPAFDTERRCNAEIIVEVYGGRYGRITITSPPSVTISAVNAHVLRKALADAAALLLLHGPDDQ